MKSDKCGGPYSAAEATAFRSDGRYLPSSSSKSSNAGGQRDIGNADQLGAEGGPKAVEPRRITATAGRVGGTDGRGGGAEAGPAPGADNQFFTFAYYVVTSDGDDCMTPNAFKIPKRSTCITLRDVKDYFPLPGTYHFRFKVRVKQAPWETSSSREPQLVQQPFVWLDVLDDCHTLPRFNHCIYIKATRLSWQQEMRNAEAAVGAETCSSKLGEPQFSFNAEGTSGGRTAASTQQQLGAAVAAEQQQGSGAGGVLKSGREQLITGSAGGTCGAFSAATASLSAPAALHQQQLQQQQTLLLERERKSEATVTADMLLLGEDLPATPETRQPASSALKEPFGVKSGASGANLDLIF